MKTTFTSLILLLLCLQGSAQYVLYNMPDGRRQPTVKQAELSQAKLVTDISQDLWRIIVMPFQNQMEQENHYRLESSAGYFIYPQVYNYHKLIDFVSVEIHTQRNGKALTASSSTDVLTPEQKEILRSASPGSDIRISIKYSYKSQSTTLRANNKVVVSSLKVTVVPAREAEYPGGFVQLKKYLVDNVVSRIPEKGKDDKLQRLAVQFTINEEGAVVDPTITSSSTDKALDALLIDMLRKMPRWQPASDGKGYKVKQELKIQMASNDGC